MIGLKEKYERGKGRTDFYRAYCDHLYQLLQSLDYDAVAGVVDCFLNARQDGNKIFFAGNGGSAATSSHFAQDLAEVGRKVGLRGFKTLSLTDNVSAISAIGNDYGYEEIFTKQMAELFCRGDVLVSISASGNSPNVVKATKYAKELGGKTIALVGFDGGQMKSLCDHVIHVKSPAKEYGPVEDIHMVIDHMITSYLIFSMADGSVSHG